MYTLCVWEIQTRAFSLREYASEKQLTSILRIYFKANGIYLYNILITTQSQLFQNKTFLKD